MAESMVDSMQEKVTLQSDTRGYLRLLRSSSFNDPYVFLAEALQNAQRAKATEVEIWVTDKSVKVTDNGPGLENPEDLFTIAQTGWDSETTAQQQPFGIGFFAALALGDTVTVRSRNRWFRFNYQELVASKDLVIASGLLEQPVNGFEVEVEDLISSYESTTAYDTARSVCRTIRTILSRVNGTEVEKKDYLTPPESRKVELINLGDRAKGWIAVTGYYWSGTIAIYHEDRFVTNLQLQGIEGAISVELSLLNLRVPDRRDIIRDKKYTDFIEYMKSVPIKNLLFEHLRNDDLNPYQMEIVGQYLKPADYAEFLKYTLLDLENLQPLLDRAKKLPETELKRMSKAEFGKLFEAQLAKSLVVNEDTTWSKSYPTSFSPPSDKLSDPGPTIIQQVEEIRELPHSNLEFSEIQKHRAESRIYYAEPLDLKTHTDIIERLVEFGRSIFIARTQVEVNCLKDNGAIYIGQAQINNKSELSISPRKDSPKARRVAALLTGLLKDLKKPREIKVGRLTELRTTEIDGTITDRETVHPSFLKDAETLVIDIEAIKRSRILSTKDPRADIGELFFILQNITDLSRVIDVGIAEIVEAIPGLKIDWIVTNRISSPAEPKEDEA